MEQEDRHEFVTPKVVEVKRLGLLAYAQTITSLPDNVFLHPTATPEPPQEPEAA